MYRVELPGPQVKKDIAADAKVRIEIPRAKFNELATKGHVGDWREAFATGEAKATGIEQVMKLIVNVVERQEERARTRKARPSAGVDACRSRATPAASRSASRSCASISPRPASQKPGIGQVDADDLGQLLGRAGAARGEQLQVPRDERLALLAVAAVDREREQLPVRVGVHVPGRVDEVRDVGPPASGSPR